MKDFLIILGRNFGSPIVIAILILATTLLVLGERRDAFFISAVITVNTLFAIVQEVRAKLALRKLELLTAPHAQRQLPDGTFEQIMYDLLCTGDTIRLQTGDEVPADGMVVDGTGLEVDESMLTGESAAVEKDTDATVYAGSSVVAGGALLRVTAVGAATKAGTMTATLKRYSPQLTPLQRAIWRAITLLTYGALGLAALIFVVYYASGKDAITIFKTITSGAVTIVPEGLLLASSLLLAFGSLKLAQARVLPQKLSAIEAMALLNVLCVDKTGTLTSDVVTLETVEFFDHNPKRQVAIRALIAIAGRATGDANATGRAIASATDDPGMHRILDTLAFSSARKMSGVRVDYGGKTQTLLMGAPEFLEVLAPLTNAQRQQVDALVTAGRRVLLAASFDDQTTPLKKLAPGSGHPVGLVVLGNALREGVQDTVAYLQKNGVSLRVISGDNPQTVRYVASAVGIKNSDKVITGAELAMLGDKAWDKAVRAATIFARVQPEQKERLIATFQKHDNFTGMVGDGVNDALALKKADLGVAMYAGATASRRVADIVLLDNSFTSLPLGMHLGNRIMQAIEVIATLFFHKIIFGVVLLLATLLLALPYPFDPRHVTFMNIFLVTLPTIMWTLFPPNPQHRVQPMHFWRDTLWAVAPIALISGVAMVACYALTLGLNPGMSHADAATNTIIVATFFGVYLVFLASRMLNVTYDGPARLARIFYIVSASSVALLAFGSQFVRDFFDFTRPNWAFLWPTIAIVVAAATLQYWLAARAGNRLKAKITRA